MENRLQPLTKTSSHHRSNADNISTFPVNMLPGEIQIRILSRLSTDETLRCQTVCKPWQMGIKAWASRTPMDYTAQTQKPFYFMYNTEKAYIGTYAYNSDKEKWVSFMIPNSNKKSSILPLELPPFSKTDFYISASRGLVCFMDTKSQDNIFVCNPVIKSQIRLLPKAPGGRACYCTISMSTDVSSKKFVVAMVKSFPLNNSSKYKEAIQLYKSDSNSWVNLCTEKVGWLGGETCVICNDILYTVAQFPCVLGDTQPFHEILAYNLSQASQKNSLAITKVSVPCALTRVRLLNLNGALTVVGGIPKDKNMKIKTIGIWKLCENKLKQITQAPDDDVVSKFLNEIDGAFSTSGCGNLVFIQSCISRTLLMYDFSSNVWKVVPKAPLPFEDHDSHYFNGFCFEPRLDIIP
ncbi:hypothetical protein LUZ62_090947 [Rhynchospora pubera]|uniref:F-box domain-containing protein n=1 Tax=Rhynchospora pubera TaxID=906938 RepID=A0AAV8CQQ4_9POAL|nr:hypothetical protein LUZ62_090947 [Rhynchospora pubera]